MLRISLEMNFMFFEWGVVSLMVFGVVGLVVREVGRIC